MITQQMGNTHILVLPIIIQRPMLTTHFYCEDHVTIYICPERIIGKINTGGYTKFILKMGDIL